MSKNSLKISKSLVLKPQASAPTSPENGEIYYDSTLNQFQKYENGVWAPFSVPGSITINDTDFTIRDATDSSKHIVFDAAGSASTTTTIASSQTANRTVTLPDATTTLLGNNASQTVTNKDIDGGTASNTSRLTVPKASKSTLDGLTRKEATLVFASDTDKLYVDDGSTLKEVGSGSGSAGLDQTIDVLDYNVFDSLTDLSAFTVTGTTALQSTNPLDGTKSVSIPSASSLKKVISVPAKYRGKKMALRLVLRSTASYGNLTCQFRDETNSANIGTAQSISTGSVPFIANTTSASATLSSVTNLTPRIGMQVTGSGIPSNTLITSLSPVTLSQNATATASSVALRASAIAQPQTLQVDVPDNCASISWLISVAAESGVETVVDDVMFVYVPAIQQALVQEPDSYLRITGFTVALGSTATRIVTMTSGGVIQQNTGDAIQYLDDAINGARFVARKEGLFTFNFSSDLNTAAGGVGFSLNTLSPATSWTSIPQSEKLTSGYDGGANGLANVSAQGYLKVGDIVRVHTEIAVAPSNNFWSTMTVSYQGSLKQVNVASDQKIEIPRSELRFEGTTSRGSTDTYILKFSSLVKSLGSAFSVVNTAANGTAITVLKDGFASFNASVGKSAVSETVYLSKNQTVLTAAPAVSEWLSMSGDATANALTQVLSWSGYVKAGDIIRIAMSTNPQSGVFELVHLDTSVQVSVSNTLPQWSDSDQTIRVNTANGYGSTNTAIRRFSNVESNTATDILYIDSATLGASWAILKDGEYTISYSDTFSSQSNMGIVRNATTFTGSLGSLPGNVKLAITTTGSANYVGSCSWSGQLSAGDIIRAFAEISTGATPNHASFTISKQGKPNVTGVDVTPFVNIKTDQSTVMTANSGAKAGTSLGLVTGFSNFTNTNTSILSQTSSRLTAIKKCTINISWYWTADTGTNNTIRMYLYKNGSQYGDSAHATNQTYVESNSADVSLEVGEYLEFYGSASSGGLVSASYSLKATAEADTVITPVTSFSTDTAALVFKSTAIVPGVDPIGTFNVYQFSANSFTGTISSTAPTQTTSDMAANGIKIFAKSYNVASTAGNPPLVRIYIGKGMKGITLSAYSSTGKVGPAALDLAYSGTSEFGTAWSYEESTGILNINAACMFTSANTSKALGVDIVNNNSITSAYFVINASKSPTVVTSTVKSIVVASAHCSATVSVTANNPINFDTKDDDVGSLITTGSSWKCTVNDAGLYSISGFVNNTSTLAASNLVLYKNGSPYKTIGFHASNGQGVIYGEIILSAKDYIDVRPNSNVGYVGGTLATAGVSNIFISKIL